MENSEYIDHKVNHNSCNQATMMKLKDAQDTKLWHGSEPDRQSTARNVMTQT